MLPENLKSRYRNRLIDWMAKHQDQNYLHEHEINHMQRLIDYLDIVKTPHSDAFEISKLHNDFKKFYSQYDQRRNKNFVKTFSNLVDWYNTL